MIAKASKIMSCPIIGSGDINSYRSLEERKEYLPSVSKIIIGRGAIRNPWIFEEIRTGKTNMISVDALVYSLATLGLIQYGFKREFDTLVKAVAELDISNRSATDSESWRKTYEILCEALFDKVIKTKDLDFERYTFSRIKMVWNYLRSSLPETFFKPTVLRSKSFGQLEEAIRSIASSHDSLLEIKHNKDMDWIFTTSKKDPNC